MNDMFGGTDKPLRILWFGDGACVTTGFGRVASGILDGLYKTGRYDIVQLGLNYYGDPHKKPYDIFPLRNTDRFGIDRLYEVLKGINPDIFITNNDIWAMKWMVSTLSKVRQELNKPIPWIAYFPIDGGPVKPSWINFIKNHIDIPITYTQWAIDSLKKVEPDLKVGYVYHGVDTSVFSPDENVKNQMREQISEQIGVDIKFTIGYVGRNQPRKRLPELMHAYKRFASDKNDVLLYLHTKVVDRGWELNKVKEVLQIPDKNPVLITPNHVPSMGMPDDRLANIYRFFDVLCLPTIGEGFGLPLIEGMASGCPIVSTNCSVIPEIVGGGAGILVEPEYAQIMPADQELIRPMPGVGEMAKAFQLLYENKDVYNTMSGQALTRASMFEGWNIPYWESVIERASKIIENKTKGGLDFDLDLFEEVE